MCRCHTYFLQINDNQHSLPLASYCIIADVVARLLMHDWLLHCSAVQCSARESYLSILSNINTLCRYTAFSCLESHWSSLITATSSMNRRSHIISFPNIYNLFLPFHPTTFRSVSDTWLIHKMLNASPSSTPTTTIVLDYRSTGKDGAPASNCRGRHWSRRKNTILSEVRS